MAAENDTLKIPEMVERVARLLACNDALHGMKRAFTAEERAAIMADIYLPWVRYTDLAREILLALREPTLAMVRTGARNVKANRMIIQIPQDVWEAMIDRALEK